MVRSGGFSLSIHMRGRDLDETKIDGHTYMQAEPGSSFAVVVGNNNGATYAVRLFVDGKEAEPGYIKKIRPNEDTVFKGWICEGKDVLEFLFARTPIEDDDARAASSSSSPSSLGEVRALIYATRRVRVESSSSESDDDDRRRDDRRRSSASLGTTALPEKAAIKELGVQSRAGGQVDRLPNYRRRRRGDYRVEKIKPECATLVLRYRDAFWFARHAPASASSTPSTHVPLPPPPTTSTTTTAVKPEPQAEETKWWRKEEPPVSSQPQPGGGGARPMARRAPGETARGPDGKRRRKEGAGGEVEVVELSD